MQSRSSPKSGAPSIDYGQATRILKEGDIQQQRRLAQAQDTPPEILYYLAESGCWEVRQDVATNPSTPIQASVLLSQDEAEEVRAELASKIGRLLPHLSEAQRKQLREQAITVVEALAQDQAPRVRALLAEAIKAHPEIPKSVIHRLAHDPELLVCGPILQYSPLLNDVDLKEIISVCRTPAALPLIAQRSEVSADLSNALVKTGDIAAVAALLSNVNAQIREDTLDTILDGAPTVEPWHEPLVLRSNLSIRAIRRIAGFVASSLVERLVQVQAVGSDLADELLAQVRHQINAAPVEVEDPDAAEQEAERVVMRGLFNDQWVIEQLETGRRLVITLAIGLAAELAPRIVRRMVDSKSGRVICALCWKAGLSARTAYDVQQRLGHVSPAQLVTPRDGRDYPLSPDEMEWLLEANA